MDDQHFNTRALKKVKWSLEDDPSADLSSVLPQSYPKRLKLLKEQGTNAHRWRLLKLTGAVSYQGEINITEEAEIKETIAIESDSIKLAYFVRDATIVNPLSCEVESLFGTILDTDLSTQLWQIIANGEVLWRSSGCSGYAVVKCNSAVIVKIVSMFEDYTEYNTPEYLNKHASTISVPKPLGLLVFKNTAYTFISFISGQTVRAIWATLTIEQKSYVKNQLEKALAILRGIGRPLTVWLAQLGKRAVKILYFPEISIKIASRGIPSCPFNYQSIQTRIAIRLSRIFPLASIFPYYTHKSKHQPSITYQHEWWQWRYLYKEILRLAVSYVWCTRACLCYHVLQGCKECKEDGRSVHSIIRLQCVIDSVRFTLTLCLTLHSLACAVFDITSTRKIPIALMVRRILLNCFLRCHTTVTCYICFSISLYQSYLYARPKGEDPKLSSRTRFIGKKAPMCWLLWWKCHFASQNLFIYVKVSKRTSRACLLL